VSALILVAPTAALATIDAQVNITANDFYGVGVGSLTQVVSYQGGFGPAGAVQLRDLGNVSCTDTDPNNDFIYVTAWSDDAAPNGVLADFLASVPASAAVTGVGPWTVCATGSDFDTAPGPTQAAVNAAIAGCTWRGFHAVSPGWTSGELNDSLGGNFPFKPGIGALAQWLWYLDPTLFPLGYTNPGPGGEFYIFRISACWPENAGAVSYTGDYHNTGGIAGSFEFIVTGKDVCPVLDADGPCPGPPTCTSGVPAGGSTVSWTCSIPAGSKKHAGFTMRGTTLPQIDEGFDPNSIVNCAHHMNAAFPVNGNGSSTGSARSGRIEFTNSSIGQGNCESTTLFVHDVVAEWYGDEVRADDSPALVDLNPAAVRRPSQIGKGPFSPNGTPAAISIAPGTSSIVNVSLGQPSGRTGHVAITYTVGLSATPDPNTDNVEFVLLPVSAGDNAIPTLSEWGMISLVALLLLSGTLLIRRRRQQTPIA